MVGRFNKELLENGLRVISVPMNTASVTVLLLIGAGSRYERALQNGISHFLEHMAFKGTKKRPSTLEIAATIEGIGGVFNAFTSKDHTGYWIKAAAKHLPLMVDILSDMLLNSLFKEEEIEREKGVIIEEINMYEDTPARKVSDEYERLLYGETSLGWEIAGRKEIIRSLQRKDFLNYMNNLYAPNNCVVVVVGGVAKTDYAAVQRVLEECLGSWQKKKPLSFEKIPDKQSAPQVRVIRKKTEQVHLCLGVRAISLNDSRRYAMGLLTTILGGGMSSRLFTEVRERRGLAYYVRSETNRYQDVGNFVTQAGVDPRKVEETVKVILEEYAKIRNPKSEIRNEELKKAKEFVKGNLILSLEDSKAVASLYGGAELLEGKIRTPEEIIKKIDQVTVEEVTDLAREIFARKNLNLALIGQFKEGVDRRFKGLLRL